MADGPLWISEAEVEALLDPLALVAAIEAGFVSAAAGSIREPGSMRLDGLDGGGAYMTLYPASAADGFASAKILAGRPANAAAGLPEIDAIAALVEPGAGRIAALIGARALTAMRTAASTTAALKHLIARPPVSIGLVGTGAQALAHGRMLAAAGLAAEFSIASPRGDAGKATAAVEAISATGVAARPDVTSMIAAHCDVIICMSLASRPLELGPLKPDLIIAGVGPFYPHQHEIDPVIVREAALVVSDDPERLRRQWAGSPLLDTGALRLIAMAELLSRRATYEAGMRVYLSDGRAFQDNVAATLVYRAALAQGRGQPLS